MSYSDAPRIGWDRGLTMGWKPRKDKDGWSWSYADDFLPILHAACPPDGLRKSWRRLTGLPQES